MENDGVHAEGIASCSAGVTSGYRRRYFVGELPRWGGGAVMDLPVEPAVAGGIGGSVFPAASAGMMAGAPTAAGSRGAAPAVAGSIGGSVFPAASAGLLLRGRKERRHQHLLWLVASAVMSSLLSRWG